MEVQMMKPDQIEEILEREGFYCPALRLRTLKPPCKDLKSRPEISESVLTYGNYIWLKTPVVPIVCRDCDAYHPPVSVEQSWQIKKNS
jgi:hypothetical protein